MAGCGHRESTFQNNTEVRFGGAWLPAPPDAPNMSTEELQEIALRSGTPAVQAWVKACRTVFPGIKRGDRAPLRLELPEEQPVGCEMVGIYTKKSGTWEEFELAYDVPMRVDVFQKPNWQCQQTQGIKNLAEVYEVMQWRREERAQRFQPYPTLRKDVVFIAAQRFPDLHNQVIREQQSWPLSYLRTAFVLKGRQRGVGREALICMHARSRGSHLYSKKRGQDMVHFLEKRCR